MNILISGSCKINDIVRVQIKDKLIDVMKIMDEVQGINIYIRKRKGKFQAIIKAPIVFKKHSKTIKVKGKGVDILKAVDKSIIKLSNRFFKRLVKYRKKDQSRKSKAA